MSKTALNTKIANEIESTKNAILAIPQPFRNNIGDEKVPVAQSACVALGVTLNQELKAAVQNAYHNGTITDAEMDSVVSGFVNKPRAYVRVIVCISYYYLILKNQKIFSAGTTAIKDEIQRFLLLLFKTCLK